MCPFSIVDGNPEGYAKAERASTPNETSRASTAPRASQAITQETPLCAASPETERKATVLADYCFVAEGLKPVAVPSHSAEAWLSWVAFRLFQREPQCFPAQARSVAPELKFPALPQIHHPWNPDLRQSLYPLGRFLRRCCSRWHCRSLPAPLFGSAGDQQQLHCWRRGWIRRNRAYSPRQDSPPG